MKNVNSMNELMTKKESSRFPKSVPPEEFDWESIKRKDEIFSYRDRHSLNLSPEQKRKLALYEGKTFTEKPIEENMVVNGEIVKMSKREIVIDANYKDNIFVELKQSDWEVVKDLKIGDNVDVLIKEIQNEPHFLIKGSITDLVKIQVADKMKDCYKENVPLIGKVEEVISAGYMIQIEMDKIKVKAFMPNTLADVNKLHDPNELLGKKIKVMVESLQQDRGVYVVSRKKYLKTLIPEKIKNLLYDKVYEGKVTGTTPFGVFVQFEGCLTGMIHKVNINREWRDRINKIEPGTIMAFYIKDIIKGNKIILTQTLEESLWDTIKYGMIIEGEVVSIKPFGALIKLDYETIGLLKTPHLNRMERKPKKGDKIKVKVVKVIREERKIYLNLADDDNSDVNNKSETEKE